ncbi:MAG TPA: hypothetical protein H9800_03130 [Candidatus Microbacterium stercoravium]|uniref:BMP family ABC transporter substrate-binding protein n=1 Tax=Candidatus Microbacterium stercoravium TaxID=2838697 RepID=A0A9D2H4M0_9MICO|nr:hypothetical protein [Candidatus Microbacterium stercoravium]
MGSSSRMRRPAALLTAAALVLMLAGCGASDPAPGADHAADQAEDAYAPVPEPGRTIEATPPAEAVDVSGWRIAVVVPDGDTATQTLLSAVGESADRNGAHVEEFGGDVDVAFADALDADADVVIGLGEGTSDVFAYEASQWLDREFLILGAQAAEPTDNVTAVIWEGATSRGSGAPADGDLDPEGVTAARAADAVAAGLESVAGGVTGIVLHLGR